MLLLGLKLESVLIREVSLIQSVLIREVSLIQSVLIREVSLFQSVLIREVSLIQSVLIRVVPLYSLFCVHCTFEPGLQFDQIQEQLPCTSKGDLSQLYD